MQLLKLHSVSRDLLPPKRYHGNLSKQLIDQRRLQLESYLQKLIHRSVNGECRVSVGVEEREGGSEWGGGGGEVGREGGREGGGREERRKGEGRGGGREGRREYGSSLKDNGHACGL